MGKLISVVTLFLMMSCATGSGDDYRKEISGLTDMSIEYIEGQWGKPDYNLPKTKGRTVKFNKVLYIDTDPVTEVSTRKLCTVRLQLTKKGSLKTI